MKLVLLAGVIAMLLSIAAGPAFIAFVRRHALGQQIREEGPAGHMSKQGTPTMGGLILLSCALLTFAVLTKRTTPALTVAGVDHRLRRHRLRRRLVQARPPPLAGPVGPLEDAGPAGRDRRRSATSRTASTCPPTSTCR